MLDPAGGLKVLVADDHQILRLGVRHLLGERARVSEAASLAEARALMARESFDLLLLDLGLGDDFSLQALPQLRQDWPALKTKLGAETPAMLVRQALAWCGDHA